ncbi:uncharacterized protein LOC127093125 [Lathyrus oleraceus]|uniref:uncharacterized protein LOC127093125 n=1 Tax=Pisum sativum TaxID=3888 RepID=UPI0021D06E31|nr:uncharacterized protein LOC127093125 [Pisum sativum]
MVKELEMIEQFKDMSLVCELTPQSMMLGMLKINNDFLNNIKESQKLDVKLVDFMVGSNQTESNDFKVDEQGALGFRDKICILDKAELKKMILEETHRSSLSIHPGATKMYQDLKKIFGWSGMKRDVALMEMGWHFYGFYDEFVEYSERKLAELFIRVIVKFHGVPLSIVSDRDPRFTSRFWESLQEALGSKLRLSSTYHPQTDGQIERTT